MQMRARLPRHCWICGAFCPRRPHHYRGKSKTFLTRDHVLPKARLAGWQPIAGVRNIRPSCAACNELRALSGHCVGVLACVRAVMPLPLYNGRSANRVLAQWWRRAGITEPFL